MGERQYLKKYWLATWELIQITSLGNQEPKESQGV